jgi:putative membrane protein
MGPAIFDALGRGLPMLLVQFVLVLALLVAGIFIYMAITPFRERDLVRNGNAAAATVLGGALVALAIPLAALLATTGALLDILVELWRSCSSY